MDVIFDIDGTLADVEHRRKFLTNGLKDWKSFNKAMALDEPVLPIVSVLMALDEVGHRIILCTGREDVYINVTMDWLDQYNIPYNALYMRRAKDYRPDSEVKSELLDQMLTEGYDPKLVFDDRNSVVGMWRAKGIICAQVAEGNF